MFHVLVKTRFRRITVVVGVAFIALLLCACSYWRVWSYGDLMLYRRMRYHSPVAQALWSGEIAPGTPIDRVLAMASPHRTDALGPFLQVYYFPGGVPAADSICLEGTALTAKSGRLISAGSYGCTFQRTYFDVTTPSDNDLYNRLVQAKIDANSKARSVEPDLAP
jgi:hypothetical protein